MRKKMKTRLGILLALAVTLTGLPVPAFAAGADETAASFIQEAAQDEAAFEAEAEGFVSSDDITFTEEAGEEMSLGDLADEYAPAVDSDGAASYKITYVLENDCTVKEDAGDRIEQAGNPNIELGTDGTVTQTYDRAGEDILAPLVYEKEGMAARGKRTWKAAKTESVITGYTCGLTGEPIYGTRNVTVYFADNAKSSEVFSSLGADARLYPNWQVPYPVSFDRISLTDDIEGGDVENPNEDITDYVSYEILTLYAPDDKPGYKFRNWSFKLEGDTVFTEAEIGTGDDEGKYFIDVGSRTGRQLIIGAEWDPIRYKISYKGIRVSDIAADAIAADTFNDNGELLEAVEEEISADFLSALDLPREYDADTNTPLPDAAKVNEGEFDPEFSDRNTFLSWSRSRKYRKDTFSLGRGGEIRYGDVTLYVIYTSNEPIPREVSANRIAEKKEFTAKQVTVPNILHTDEYAVVNLIGKGLSADPETLTLSGNNAQYFELCDVDGRKAELGRGYAAVGIRLKKDVDSATAVKINKSKKLRGLTIMVQTVNGEKDEEDNPVYQAVDITLKTSCKMPKYKLSKSSVVIYANALGKDKDGNLKKAVFYLTEKQGRLNQEMFGGDWEAAFVTKDKKEVDPSDISAVFNKRTGEIRVEAGRAVKGYIRIRNTDWLKGAYAYMPFNIKMNMKASKISLTKSTVILNNSTDKEVATTKLIFKSGMEFSSGDIQLKGSLPEGIKVTCLRDTITVKGAKDVKKGTYKLKVYSKGIKKPVTLKIKVVNTPASKAVRKKVKGKFDAVAGGSIYILPTIKGYTGTVESVRVVADKPEYDVYWDGRTIELASNKNYVPKNGKRTINLMITMTTGVELPLTVQTSTSTGKLALKVYDATMDTSGVLSGDTVPLTAYTPVIATYTYTCYDAPDKKVKKLYTIDMTRDNGKLLTIDAGGLSKPGAFTGEYENGRIRLTNLAGKLSAPKNYTITLKGKNNITNKKVTTKFSVMMK